MSAYSHIFFDLDGTIWDYQSNSKDTIEEIFLKNNIGQLINSGTDGFYKSFLINNGRLWEDFRGGKILKSTISFKRFYLTLKDHGIESNKISKIMSEDFALICPLKTKLVPGAIDVLNYLKNKYSLNVITNGFRDIQMTKIRNSKLSVYFDNVIISGVNGVHKPDVKIFRKALSAANAKKSRSIMVGDDLAADILGAKSFGIDQVYFNPSNIIHNEAVTYEINNLKELMGIL